ncbi:MAG: AAA family ATPase [Bacillota bacterium]|jgi:cytidylate kinase
MEMMSKSKIITIGREFCSGGADIGHMVADHFGIPCYNKTILDKTAEKLHVDKELVEKYDERSNSMWRNFSGYQYGYGWYTYDPALVQPLHDSIAEAQFAEIRRFAEEGPCVLIGRCADYVLSDRDDVLSVFIRADMEKRMARAERLYDISPSEAKKLIRRTDKIRAAYYEAHTDRTWGSAGSFDLILDSGRLGLRPTADLIIEAVNYFAANDRAEFE